ncbi:MAG: hypothetical protein ACRDKZ_09160 [Actinomycetota bacterium]
MSKPDPMQPEQAGVAKESPEAMQIEGAELLANDAREELRRAGFEDEEIDRWAETYIAEEGSGDVASFVAWINAREKR